MSEEDTAEYWLFPASSTGSPSEAESVLSSVFSVVEGLTRDYVWTRQPFNLTIQQTEPGGKWWLAGRTYYGENVMDEWLIVSLLYEITKEMELVARITDSDGEILLIEAADQLPRWAGEPERGDGRVFIYRGELHLVSVCESPGSISAAPATTPPPPVCAGLVAQYPALSRAPPPVQAVIRRRLGGLPRDTRDNHHVTNLEVPGLLARLLSHNSAFLSCLVSAVCERDPVETRQTRAMARVRQERMVSCSLKFSRCLYALLNSTQVQPHRSSGWTVRSQSESLGFKLALGLEILLARHRAAGPKSGQSSGRWRQFRERLVDSGYFKQELEGSVRYKQLENQAHNFFLASSDERSIEDDLCQAFDSLKEENISVSELQGGIVNPPVAEVDSEDWMEMTPDILDKMLEAQFGVTQENKNNSNIPSEVNKFLNKMSDMAGVEYEEEAKDAKINLEPDNFAAAMKNLLTKMEETRGSDLLESDTDDEDSTDSGEEDPIMTDYMSKLDDELPKEEDDIDKPLNIDTKVLSNLLQSYSEELGHGPVSSLLQSMRVNPGRKDADHN